MLALGLLWGPAGLAAGCGAKQPELVVDPALANKPFPTVQSVGGTAPARPAAFPSVGERRGP